MTMDVSRYAGARDLLAIALTCCAAIVVVAVIAAAILAIPVPHAVPARYVPGMKGSVSLEHVGSSGAWWSINSFKLTNQSDHTVYFRGYSDSHVMAPWATTYCQFRNEAWARSPPLVDPPPEEQFIEIHPGTQRVIDVDSIGDRQRGECHLVLTLTDGTDVQSNTWTEPGNGR